MTALITNDANGLDGGLVVLRDIVSFGCSPSRGKSLSQTVGRLTSEPCAMRVVSKNVNELLDD